MPKLLFVEDDPFIAEIYEKKLSLAGFTVEKAASGKEALKHSAATRFDLILLDLVLPELGGVEVLREIRGKPAEYGVGTKVVIFSNLSGPDERARAVKEGADGFISKTDFTPTEVVEEVQRYLKQFAEQERHAKRGDGPGADLVHAEGRPLGKRILLIEDEEVFVEMFGKCLRDEGYVVDAERTGSDGLRRAQTGEYDLIITDVVLPGLDGRQLIAKLRESETTPGPMPIFVFSASLDSQELQGLEDDRIIERAFLKTKITPSELTEAVNAYFDQKE